MKFYAGVMGKGTLQDILSDEKITLDDMFKSSMIGDAAKVISDKIKCLIMIIIFICNCMR